ncbi:YdaS family helix-turn-helix protein [Vibrio metoecus]|uniref:YdaS family helix-turn-helix protein n=1 Tax=Vibrio metoecus TaxID=1481663 RepID=UPI0013021C5F|nr:YdaS family helix-turn-helix protein [Vibrio metoecus]EKF9462198.1 hypothetical protein [Vibrio cholerae]
MYAEYWRQLDVGQRELLAQKLKTNTDYLRQVLYGYRKAGAKLAKQLDDLTCGKIDKQVLRPDYF